MGRQDVGCSVAQPINEQRVFESRECIRRGSVGLRVMGHVLICGWGYVVISEAR